MLSIGQPEGLGRNQRTGEITAAQAALSTGLCASLAQPHGRRWAGIGETRAEKEWDAGEVCTITPRSQVACEGGG